MSRDARLDSDRPQSRWRFASSDSLRLTRTAWGWDVIVWSEFALWSGRWPTRKIRIDCSRRGENLSHHRLARHLRGAAAQRSV